MNTEVSTLGAIDIGSNAIRLAIGEVDSHGDIRVIKKVREPVRLGKDVFSGGEISAKTREKAIAAFQRFGEQLRANDVQKLRAVATSALREAKDRDSFVAEILEKTGIAIDIIDGVEEGRLIFSAVNHKTDLTDQVSLLIDIGGGSVELTIADHGVPIATQTFPLGTVRLLQKMAELGIDEKQLPQMIDEHIQLARQFLTENLKDRKLDAAIGTGGNFECFGKLRVALLQKSSIFSMTQGELEELSIRLSSVSVNDRIEILRLRPDRADVVVPAAIVAQAIMKLADVERLMIPYVGLRDGILADLATRM